MSSVELALPTEREPAPPALEPFDLAGDLPAGTTVLEASAGTGKTHAIAALVARYVAEGHAELDELLLVTFGRMATDELRLRIRDRLVMTERALAGSPADDPADPITRRLLEGGPDERERRRQRIRRALADFDAATIATTHEFCRRMLDGLGILGDREPDATFTEWLGELADEVARDVYLRRYAERGDAPFPFEDAQRMAALVVGSPHTRLVPEPEVSERVRLADPGGPAWLRRVAYAEEVRAELERRKRRLRVFSYDDMLVRLRDALAHPRTGELAAERLRRRYRIVLVDEFQDTDVVQWEILRRAFVGHSTVVLIGDPKQAIYAFRGADVYSYLDARRQADRVATLQENWRSDETLTGALEGVLGGAALGEAEIVVHPVRSRHHERRLSTASGGPVPAFRLRVVPPLPDPQAVARVSELRPQIQQDLVADVVALLADPPAYSPSDGPARPIRASDVAVLVRKNARGEALSDALVAAGVPAVVLGSTSVFGAPVATDWLTLLGALEQPRPVLARGAALTCFLGWTFGELAAADEPSLTALTAQVRRWSRVLASRGVAALLELATVETDLTERLLRQQHGERALTDLRHIGQALHAAMVANRLGIGALRDWLREQIARARREAGGDTTRRLETDAHAVCVLTLHRSKGLEFPIVYLPEPWDAHTPDTDAGEVLRLHDDRGCLLDVGGVGGPGRRERLARARREDAGEELRLLYVGLTRAKCQVVAWWAASRNTPSAPLHRFLSRAGRTGEPDPAYPRLDDPIARFRFLRELGSAVAVELVEPRAAILVPQRTGSNRDLAVRTFTRELDLGWRRTSYSALTAPAHGLELGAAGVGSEPDLRWEDDEAAAPPPADRAAEGAARDDGGPSILVGEQDEGGSATGLDRPAPLRDFPGGTTFGTQVHAILESVDPTSDDLGADLRRACASTAGVPTGFSAGDRDPGAAEPTSEALAEGLRLALLTPLGPLAGDRRLADIGPADRLTELSFELPLGGGDRPADDSEVAGSNRGGRLGDLAPLLREHLPSDDPLRSYPDLLEHPALAGQSLRGYLTGSIDAVLRVREGGSPRYLVVDYKTNWLKAVDSPDLRLGDYAPGRLARAMISAHYPLQALLYSVALHRMLRWRQPGYAPEVHLGGVLYLFLRGMAGPDTPRVAGVPCGVFGWHPPAALIIACSDQLERGPV